MTAKRWGWKNVGHGGWGTRRPKLSELANLEQATPRHCPSGKGGGPISLPPGGQSNERDRNRWEMQWRVRVGEEGGLWRILRPSIFLFF